MQNGSKVFKDLVAKYLIGNSHRTTVDMVPSKTMEAEALEVEKGKLAEIKKNLSEEQLEEIIANTAELKRQQAAEDSASDIATIPSLTISDLETKSKEYPIEVLPNYKDSGVTVVKHELSSTSGIVYADVGFDISNVDFEDITLLPLFTRIMMETGAGDLDR